MNYILYSQLNNRLSVVYNSQHQDIKDILKIAVPVEAKYKIVSSIDIDNDFFNAYEFDQEVGAKLNISKTKEIWLEHYRRARTPLLEKLDLEYMRADEAGNLELKKEIVSKKQALRDVTRIDLPNTIEEIKATWPEVLGKNPFDK